jgi:hypothetical protein
MTEEQKARMRHYLWNLAVNCIGKYSKSREETRFILMFCAGAFATAWDLSVEQQGDEVASLVEKLVEDAYSSPLHFIWTYLYEKEQAYGPTSHNDHP